MTKHPNKIRFRGVLAVLDVATDAAPSGARGHCVILTKQAAAEALESLIGMGVNHRDTFDGHRTESKIGIIDTAVIVDNRIEVAGYLFRLDAKGVIHRIEAATSRLGMSYELDAAHVEDMRAKVWTIIKIAYFTGAAIIDAEKAACKSTSFELERD